jgi:hypothetical protein
VAGGSDASGRLLSDYEGLEKAKMTRTPRTAPQREFSLLSLRFNGRNPDHHPRGQRHGRGSEPPKYGRSSDPPPWGREHSSTPDWSFRDWLRKCHTSTPGLFHPEPPRYSLPGCRPFECRNNTPRPQSSWCHTSPNADEGQPQHQPW